MIFEQKVTELLVMIAKMIDHKIYNTAFLSTDSGYQLKKGNLYIASALRSKICLEPEENSAQSIAKIHLGEYLPKIYKYLFKFCEDNTQVSYFLLEQDEFFSRQLAIFQEEVSELLQEIMNNTMGYGDIKATTEKIGEWISLIDTISSSFEQ